MSTMDKIGLKIIFIDAAALLEAQSFISGCQHCAWTSETTFHQLLDAVTGSDPETTEYVIHGAASCPCCNREITENTFITAT